MSQIKNKLTLNLILIFSVFALSMAYFIQYVLDHKPCNLCLIERLPYISAIVIIFLNIIFKKFEKTKGWLGKKISSSGDQKDQLVKSLEEKSIWQRYGF